MGKKNYKKVMNNRYLVPRYARLYLENSFNVAKKLIYVNNN